MTSSLRAVKPFLTALFLLTSVISGCSKDSSNPAGPSDNNGNNNTNVSVIESKSSKIDVQGGTVSLSDGIKVVIPDGALTASSTISVVKVDPKSYFDGSANRVVVSCEGAPAGGFGKEVELIVPLPDGMTEADSSGVFAALIDEETGAFSPEAFTVRMIDGKPAAVVTTTHFSSRLVEWLIGEEPPQNGGILTVPYYNQGESQYCWATSVQMVTAAARFDTSMEITDIIGRMAVDEGGITGFTFRLSPTLSGIVNNRTGLRPERASWDFINYGQMKRYLKQQIGLKKRPVALFNGVWEHAVVIVGYDGDTFYIHDPASTNPSAIGYKAMSWSDIVKGMSYEANLATLVVPTTSLDSSRPDVTVNFVMNAFDFIKPAVSGSKSAKYVYKWDSTESAGYSFQLQPSGDKTSPLPGDVQTIAGNVIELYNASQSASHTVDVWLDIYAGTEGKGHFSQNTRVDLAPNSKAAYKLPTTFIDEFRWNDTKATDYLLTVKVMEGSTTVDEESIHFIISPEEVKINSVTPTSGGRGGSVTVKGKGFGAIQKSSFLTFNTTKLTVDNANWSDTQIVFSVPADAPKGSNTITVTNGAVTSNKVQFTVTDVETLSGSTERKIDYAGRNMTLTSNWSITGAGIYSEYLPDDYGYYFKVKANTPAQISLDIDYTADFTSVEQEHYSVDGVEYYYEYTYSNPHLAVMPAGYEDADDPFDVVRVSGGHFPITLSSSKSNNYTIDFTLNNYVSWQRIQLLVWVVYDETTTKYMVTESGDVAVDVKENNDTTFWAFSYLIDINPDIFGKAAGK